MKTNTLIAVIIALLIGGGIGYAMNNNNAPMAEAPMMMDHSMMNMNDMDMASMMRHMAMQLANKTGDDLDRTFLENMIIHHQGAVDTSTVIVNNSEREELRAFAQNIIDAQDKEINIMKEWLATWFTEDNN